MLNKSEFPSLFFSQHSRQILEETLRSDAI